MYAYFIFETLIDRYSETEKELFELEEELRTKNRFFPKSTFLEKIEGLSGKANTVLDKGTILYRSRLIDKSKEHLMLSPIKDEMCDVVKKYHPEFDRTKKERDILKLLFQQAINKDNFDDLINELKDIGEKYTKKGFWGYDKDNSDAPPVGISKGGRINPQGISYLYASNIVKTAIVEVRPVTLQHVSVAEIMVKESLNLFDFSINVQDEGDGKNYIKSVDNTVVSLYFSQPNYSGDDYYLVTQYISEYIKNLTDDEGNQLFDGICFTSSLDPEGKNYVLFETGEGKKYEVLNSSVYRVNNLMGDCDQVLPISI